MSTTPLYLRGLSSGPVYLKGRDYCRIGGIELPGRVTVTGLPIVNRLDMKDGAGSHGGHPTLKGLQAAKDGAISIVTWTDEQEQAVRDAIAALFPWPGTKPEALSFDSWATDELVIVTAVVLHSVTERTTVSDPPRASSRTFRVAQWLPGVRGAKAAAVKTPARATRDVRNARTEGEQTGKGTVLAPTQQPNFFEPNFTT